MKIAIVHKHYLGDNFVMPSYLSDFGRKTVMQRIFSGDPWGYLNHKAYAEHNGYVFIEDREPWYDSKPPDWSIWQAALRVLKNPDIDVDWIFFSVNDIIYVDFIIRLETYLENIEPTKFLATGTYISQFKWDIADARTDTWKVIEYSTPVERIMISGWSHFVKKCPEAIEFISKIDADQRHRTIPRFYNHASTGDEYLSVWFNNYPEYREYWHLFSTHDHIHIPDNIREIKKWNTSHRLTEYTKGKALMVFTTCAVSYNTTISLIDQYTKQIAEHENSNPTEIQQ